MKKFFSKFNQKGLPGGPNELKAFTEGFITSSEGQWAYPGMNTLIPNAGGRITMQGVNYPVLGIDDLGNQMMMEPGEEYQFPGDSVYEIPMKKGGLVKMPKLTKKNKKSYNKKFSSSIDATSRLFTESELFKKAKSRKRKVFDPNAEYQKGGEPKNKKKNKNVKPFVTSDPHEYAVRKAAYDDSLFLHDQSVKDYNYANSLKRPSIFKPKTNDKFFEARRRLNHPDFLKTGVITNSAFPKGKAYGIYTKPKQPIVFKPKSKEQQYPTSYEPVVDNTQQKPPEGKIIVGQQEVQQLDPKTGKVKTVITPIYEDQESKRPTPTYVNSELQKFVEERKPEPPGPGTDVMPVYDIDELPEYATPDGGTEWIGQTERYIDWDGNSIGYNLPRFRKPGHGGNLIKKGKRHYLHYPSIETRHNAYIQREDEEYQKGGEPKKKKRKTDDYGRYRSEDGNVRTPITPEMQAVMPPDEWGQYVQDVPEVYTTRTKEQQDIKNALDYQQRMAELYPGRPTQSDAIQPANWVFAAPMVAPMALEALGSVAATQIPGTGVSLGTVANTGFGIHGAMQVPDRIQDWQDVAAGKKDWKEATAESLMTGLELYGGLSELKGLKGVPKELPGSPNTEEMVDLWRIQEKNAKTFAQLAEEGKIPKWFNNPETLAKKAEEEKYFGQWFTNSKKDLDWYMKDREFIDPEIIQLKVPKSKLQEFQNYDKSLSRAPDREFVIPFEQQSLYKYQLPGSPNNTANIKKAGFLNPFELADEVVPNLDPFQVTTANSLLDLSPLNIVPIGKKLATKGNAYRKFGNTMKYVQESKSLSPKGGILPRIGKKQIEAEGNWAALNEPWEKYPGAFTAEFDFKVPGSNLGYSNPSSRAGVLITDASGKALPEIPLTDPGLSFHRRLPFSNRYIPIDKQKLLDNKFQMATQGAHLQSLAEKYGYGLAYAGLLGAMGNDEAVKTYNKYTIDPVIKEAKKLIKQDSKKYQDGGEENCEDGRCLETDQAQELLDKADALRYKNVDTMWDVVDQANPENGKPVNAAAIWGKKGVKTLESRLGVPNPANCMWAAGSGYQCLPETKGKMPLVAFESNDKFLNAVSNKKVPFRKVAVSQDPNFANSENNTLRTGDIINMKGPNTSHALTFSHYREDGMPIFLDSNGEASDFSWNQGLIPGMVPGTKGIKAHISRLDPEMLYAKDLKALEEKARTNPTYYEDGGVIEAELSDEEIEEYRKGGWVVEKLDAYPKGGNPRKGKKQSKNVQPFVTSDPKEYAYRKAAYDDSLRTYQMVPELRKKENYIDNHSVSIKDNQKKLYRLWNEYANKGFNYSLGYNQRLTPIKKIGDGLIAHQIYDYDKPIQPVKFKKPRSKQGATKVTKKEQPVVEQEVIKPTPIPVIINPELQKFVEERRPEPPGPPPGPGTDVMPVYDIDELPMYATPDPDAEWVGETEKYVDWDGNRIPYRLPRFRKPGHGGDLIRRGKQRYIPLPSVESRYQAEIVPEEEYDNGGNVNFQTYEEQLRQLENSIKAGYKGGRWYPHDSPEGGTKTIGYGHKMSGKENYSKGLTTAQVLAMQKKDLVKHKNIAKSMVDQKYGAGTFDRLPESRKVLLVDYAYNGVLHEFPNFMRATVKGDKVGMLKEYKRYTGSKPLTQRNEWTRSVIEGSNVGTAKTNTPKTLPAKTAPKKQPVKQPVKKPIAQPKFSSNETFSYDYRPDAVYRVADSGDWYINAGKDTHNEFIKLNDPTGKRTETLRKFAYINEEPLDQILNRINNSGNYDSRIDFGYVFGQ